jgi:hypothetical protein
MYDDSYLDAYGNPIDQNVTTGTLPPSLYPEPGSFSGPITVGGTPAPLPPGLATNGMITPKPAAAATTGGYAGAKDLNSLVAYWKQNHPASAHDLPGLINFLNQNGVTAANATHNGMQSDDKFTANGQMYDLGSSLGSPSGYYFDSLMPVDESGGGGAPATNPGIDYPAFVPPDVNFPTFKAPGAFSYDPYTPITGQQALAADPGYDFRLNQGLRGMKSNLAAQGILKTGGAERSLMDYAQGMASQEYGNADARNFRNWQAGRGAASEDYDRLWRNTITDYMLPYQAASDQFGRAKDIYTTNANTKLGFGNLNLGQGSLDLNKSNSNWSNLLDLYKISTAGLPTYQPTSGTGSLYGFSSN